MKISPPTWSTTPAGRRAPAASPAAAAFGERAAELTPEPGRRARRALTAARAEHQAGAPDAALRLLAVAQAGPLDDLGDAQAELLRAQVAAGPGRDRDARQLLLRAAQRLEPVDAALAREALRDAFTTALAAGRLATSRRDPAGRRRRARRTAGGQAAAGHRPAPGWPGPADRRGAAAGAPLVKRAISAFCDQEGLAAKALAWLPLACRLARSAWDDQSWDVLSARLIELAREAGALTALPAALLEGAAVRLAAGEPAMAAAMVARGRGRGAGDG